MISTNVTIRIYSDDIRALCIRNQYYTCGDTRAYEELLNHVSSLEDIPSDDLTNEILAIAINIYEHSDVEEQVNRYGVSKEDVLNSIFFEVGQCVRFFSDSTIRL